MTAASMRPILDKPRNSLSPLVWGGDRVNSVVTPGLKPTSAQIDGEKDLEHREHTPYRGNVARCNYFGPEEVCRQGLIMN